MNLRPLSHFTSRLVRTLVAWGSRTPGCLFRAYLTATALFESEDVTTLYLHCLNKDPHSNWHRTCEPLCQHPSFPAAYFRVPLLQAGCPVAQGLLPKRQQPVCFPPRSRNSRQILPMQIMLLSVVARFLSSFIILFPCSFQGRSPLSTPSTWGTSSRVFDVPLRSSCVDLPSLTNTISWSPPPNSAHLIHDCQPMNPHPHLL